VSDDNGLTFNDLSLIDTTLTTMEDVWVTPDGSKVFLVTQDGSDTSVWRKASEWQRILCLDDANGYILRGAPDNNDVLYVADSDATVMYFTQDGGENKWFQRASRYTVQDLAVESADVAYVARDGTKDVSKTTNAGFTWATAKSTRLASGSIHTIASLSEDNLVVGSTDGYVSYSMDGNANWVKITKQTESTAGALQVTASGLADGDFIYAVSDLAGTGTVRRWEIGESTSWKDLDAGIEDLGDNYAGKGIALSEGILYVQTANTTNSATLRTLGPTGSSVYWSTITEASATFNRTPSSLRVGSGSLTLWSIDTSGTDELSKYSDTIALTAPTLTQPADGYQNPMNPITGHSVDIGFGWEKPSDYVTDYEIRIYSDAAGTTRVARHYESSTSSSPVVVMGPNQPSGTQFVEFNPGTTYYWKVRVKSDGPTYSPWSEMRSFSVEPGQALVPALLSPANGSDEAGKMPSFSWAPVSGATEYQFVLSSTVSLSPAIIDVKVKSTGFEMTKELEAGKTYYWAVKAVAPVEGEWSAVANFTVKTPAPEPKPPVTVKEYPPPQITIPPAPPPQEIVIPPAPQPPAPIAPAYIWAIIIIGAVLVIAVIVLIVRTRRAV
jgi:hypothetical protein